MINLVSIRKKDDFSWTLKLEVPISIETLVKLSVDPSSRVKIVKAYGNELVTLIESAKQAILATTEN